MIREHTNLFDNLTVLYVEDDDYIRNSITTFLSKRVPNLIIAKDGKEGIEAYIEHKPQIVVTDIRMPYLSGLELAEEIKKDNKNIRIIVLTAHTDEQYLLKSIEIGVDGFLSKPIKLEKLTEMLKKMAKEFKYEHELHEKEMLLYKNSILSSKNEIISTLAHHWRQPLNIISILTQNIKLHFEGFELSPEDINQTLTQISEILQSLSETLTLFQTSLSNNLEKLSINISLLVEKIFFIYNSEIKENNIEFILDLEDDCIANGVEGDLMFAITSIIQNSLEAIKQKEIKNPYIKISVSKDSKNIIITIKDNGGGIEQNVLERIFEPYFSTKNNLNGTGLGLYFVKNIVEKQFLGAVTITTDDNTTSFTLLIPLKI
ncbi:MAG: response regulator [Campylobacterales bacterium]|nr:response regulator [Campylobacterales bacterium]